VSIANERDAGMKTPEKKRLQVFQVSSNDSFSFSHISVKFYFDGF